MDYLIIIIGLIIFCLVILSPEQRHKGKVVLTSLIETTLNTGVTACIALDETQKGMLNAVSPRLGAMSPAERLQHLETLNALSKPNALPAVTETPEA